MGTYRNQLDFDFGNVTFKNKTVSKSEAVENKMVLKLKKHNFKRKHKIENDIKIIRDLVSRIDKNHELNLVSKAFDSPNIVMSFINDIHKLYISTWAITPAGINSLVEIANNGIIEECILLLDKTHSYKWIFTSEAYKILKGKVKIRFCANHSKFICFQTNSGVFNFVGSMNFSNNPRFENISINKFKDDFDFYVDFIKNIQAETL